MNLKAILSKIFPIYLGQQTAKIEENKETSFAESLNDNNKMILRAFTKLNHEYQELLNNASSDYDEILIYEKFTSELNNIFHRMLKHLDMKDKKLEILTQLIENQEEILSDVEFGEYQSYDKEDFSEVPIEMKVIKVITEDANRIYKEKKTNIEKIYDKIKDSKDLEEIIDELDTAFKSKKKKFEESKILDE
ncbi:hypothetical protein PVAND_004847 [Polypedilum vanderplanki]|uniref:Uncharacterized protein n=1 Tax=Polypedilum vanderplanki TaxID=319348 RepID=A0A9J6C0A5_POLVA|nr:hypothetical protein PVAND_004847 [Polypedilum vanderplanki]